MKRTFTHKCARALKIVHARERERGGGGCDTCSQPPIILPPASKFFDRS
jgi:hypothetical protein